MDNEDESIVHALFNKLAATNLDENFCSSVNAAAQGSVSTIDSNETITRTASTLRYAFFL